ncbi:MAG TPA: helix-turn-helix domain-containing protein [Streptosporangiaceae bacterium]
MTQPPAAARPRHERPPLPPRERMLRAAVRLISMQGVTATGLREIAAAAGAPRGSLQHYFPGGKDQLVAEALAIAGEVAARRVRRYAARRPAPTPGDLFAAIAGAWRDSYASRGYAEGCPLAATATDAAAASPVLRDALRHALDTWLDSLAGALATLGVPASRTRPLALLMFAALEGALILARSREDTQPLDAVIAELRPVLDAARAG